MIKTKQEIGIGQESEEYRQSVESARKELKIEPYCAIGIIRRSSSGEQELLYRYDLPRQMMWDYMWVLEWRKARFVCMYPRDRVELVFSFYDKTSGDSIEFNSKLSKLVSAKAKLTRYRNARQRYINSQKQTLFFDENTDEFLSKIDLKIANTECAISELQKQQ